MSQDSTQKTKSILGSHLVVIGFPIGASEQECGLREKLMVLTFPRSAATPTKRMA